MIMLKSFLKMGNTICMMCNSEENVLVLTSCRHPFCRKCLYEYITKNLKPKLKCPNKRCKKSICDKDLRMFLSEYNENTYDKMCIEKCTKKCQTNICGYLFPEIIGGESAIVQCQLCLQPNCFKCGYRHYPNENHGLGENEKQKDEQALKDLKSSKMKKLSDSEMNYPLLPALTAFECSLCCNYTLPKEGQMLRCGHQWCQDCLKRMFNNVSGYEYKCPECNTDLKDCEINALIDLAKLKDMQSHKLINRGDISTCKASDCSYPRLIKDNIKEWTCAKCGSVNCVRHKCIHSGLTCQQYENTNDFKYEQKVLKTITQQVKCYNCGTNLIKKGGCNSMQCNICHKYTCLLLGIKTGKGGCECTTEKVCHENCQFGCIDEDN